MALLYKSELQDSVDWVGRNAKEILDSVRNADGWEKVFPNGIPTWLHKLRNYFNVEPKTLRLMDKSVTDHWMRKIRSHGQIGGLITRFALTGDVYFDEEVEVWYQMGAGGSIYHWGDKPGIFGYLSGLDAFHTQIFRRQKGIPIFKLICPDETGGSRETIVSNPVIRIERTIGPYGLEDRHHRSSKIGKMNKAVLVIDRVETKMEYQGSYNFAETSVKGLDKHEKYDVETHKKDSVYIDPPDRFEPLEKRVFNAFVLNAAGAETKREKRDPMKDFDEPPMRTMRK